MAGYITLRQGNSNTEENKKLQQALKDAGYGSYLGSAGVDGIYGAGTAAAVKAYQRDNGLAVDGIAGNQTLGSLYAPKQNTAQDVVAPTPEKIYRYDAENDPVYQAAQKAYEEKKANSPTLAGTYDEQFNALYDKIMNREDFKYDLNGDALWQQYKDQYTRQGKLAMMDTMGQAAALTGGYGSSYAQGVGQQAYQGYMQQLTDKVPELYQLAYQKYQEDQDRLNEQFSVTGQMRQDEYDRYLNDVSLHNSELDRAQGEADTAWNRGYETWYTQEQLRRQDEETDYSRKNDAYNRLTSLITSTGYTPSEQELQAAGMSIGEATAYASYYNKSQVTSSGGGSETEKVTGLTQEEMYELESKIQEWAKNGEAYLDRQLTYWVDHYGLDEDYAISILNSYFPEDGYPDAFLDTIMKPEDWKRRTGSDTGYEQYRQEQYARWKKTHS